MMPKISGILPSNKRITTIDVANERPLRRGTPSFGQPISEAANTREEFFKISVKDSELKGNYGPDARVSTQPIQNEIDVVDSVTQRFNGQSDSSDEQVSRLDVTV